MDIRYERTEELIRNAVTELGKKKDIRSLTVTEIAKKARISRIAFYDHYDNVDALADNLEDEMVEDFIAVCGPFSDFTVSPDRIIRRVVNYYKTTGSSILVTPANHSHLSQKSIDRIIHEIIEKTGNTDTRFEIRVTMLITGIFGVFQRKDITDEQILKDLCACADQIMK
ncbi:MAG: TetR/AcrR family transcriptional regulator [Lachnospiraceae bacterium]|nr:TetR/AcrR family transcriptional regulator [Solobacterium sp.]MBR3309975.1 TetR/AcrR family transcriptional regulator [Lachnospiraceae bacterium]